MSIDNTTGSRLPADAGRDTHSYVDWPAIIAGIFLASAISLVLIGFGSAVGLGFVGFEAGEGAPGWLIAIGIAIWVLLVQVTSFMAGGYLTGRLRRRHFDATEDESDLRDGAHGLLVWAGATLIGAILAFGGLGNVVNAAGSAAGTAVTAASSVAGGAAEGAAGEIGDPTAYFADALLRSDEPADDAAAARDQAGRILAQAALNDGNVPDADQAYLATLVSNATGLSEEEATARVDEVMTSVATAREQAEDTARTARNAGVIGAFLIAASLLVSAIGAFWAAQKAGNQRDSGTVITGAFRRF